MILCPIANHLCMALPLLMCSIVKQCWSVGYVSLLTRSFNIDMKETYTNNEYNNGISDIQYQASKL